MYYWKEFPFPLKSTSYLPFLSRVEWLLYYFVCNLFLGLPGVRGDKGNSGIPGGPGFDGLKGEPGRDGLFGMKGNCKIRGFSLMVFFVVYCFHHFTTWKVSTSDFKETFNFSFRHGYFFDFPYSKNYVSHLYHNETI